MKNLTEMIAEFRNENYFLSNMYPCKVTYNGVTYECAESAFQAQKCNEKEMFVNLSGFEAKKLGKRVALRPDWNEVREQIMYEIVLEKFKQNKYLAKCLEWTGNKMLVEGNNWNDTYWGVCKGIGSNKLGLILMRVRNELRKEV